MSPPSSHQPTQPISSSSSTSPSPSSSSLLLSGPPPTSTRSTDNDRSPTSSIPNFTSSSSSTPTTTTTSGTTSSSSYYADRPGLSTARSRGKSFISPTSAEVLHTTSPSSSVSSSSTSTSTPTPSTRPTRGIQRRSTLSTIVSFPTTSSSSSPSSPSTSTSTPSYPSHNNPISTSTSTNPSTSTSTSSTSTTRRSPALKPKFIRSVSVQNSPSSFRTTSPLTPVPSTSSSSSNPGPSPGSGSSNSGLISTFRPIKESDLEYREFRSGSARGGKKEDGVRIEIDGVPLVDSDSEGHRHHERVEEDEEEDDDDKMGFVSSQGLSGSSSSLLLGGGGGGTVGAGTGTGSGSGTVAGGSRRGWNRPPSKSVSAVLGGRPLVSIAQQTGSTLPSSNGGQQQPQQSSSSSSSSYTPPANNSMAALTERRRSTDVGVIIINQSSDGQATQTRSRSSSIATHPQFSEMGSGELYARHLPRVTSSSTYDQGVLGDNNKVETSSPGPAVRPRSGLKRRISAPNVRSSGVGGSSSSPGINSIGLGRVEDVILPTIPVNPDEAGSNAGNSLGLSKISPGRSMGGFQRFSPSPSLEPRIMEEPPSLPSSPEYELPIGSIADDQRTKSSSSPRPGRASLSTIESVTESGEGGPSYPITPRTSIPRDEHGMDEYGHVDSKNGFSSVLGGVLDGLSKAVGFNLGATGSRTYASVPADEDEDDMAVDGGRGARRPSWISLGKRRSLEETDSEKGLTSQDPSDDEAQARANPTERSGRVGKARRAQDQGSYFFLEPYANSQAGSSSRSPGDTLPTPALSRASLSGVHGRPQGSGRTTSSLFERRNARGFAASLWKVKDYLSGNAVDRSRTEVYGMKRAVSGAGFSSPEAKAERLARGRSDSLLLPKADGDESTVGMNTALRQVAGELGWTLVMIIIVFLSSFGVVAFGIKSMPITSLHSLPKQVSDLQILSAEIRTYMNSSTTGWWHTVAVLMFTGMWKHSWSIPGALILNILVGSLLPPIQAVFLLTVITSFGSLGAYMLSRPLAPLIALLFPKPLAIVRSAIKGNDATASNGVYQPQRKATDGNGVWRRLLVMRAMGLVPWSGMNVACGVVGVSWLTFLLTTAAGSASWSYVTASVGDILGQLALPKEPGNEDTDPNAGQSISSLLQDPALIAKMVILSLISLIPALFKSRSGTVDTAPPAEIEAELSSTYPHPHVSQDVQSLTPLAPTPSWWQIVNVANALVRKTTRFAHTGWNAVVGEARDDYRHLHGDDSGTRT